ncbi:metal ABC transporter substrate-binding protein [Citricoccus sp. SGAir0253]|uniref:MetQ/NlpA family ABC transporter substrate-binding protein n=1 Tax=Citricoccus sp. SGAir0253 TaxID=2567881 RepID=UPI0010CD690B|nr:MetQ/NlpA family ABC transporter substrate-binding protein [Citricoccus sp. SGAir0253]QCU79047.1 metal ABC transporter substrate-binding protein [Citricoccus sp. SGAir0253]
MSTPSAEHAHGFTLRRQRAALPWSIAALATVIALVLGIVVIQQSNRPAVAASGAATSEVTGPLRVHYEPAMAGEEKILDFVAEEIAPDHGVEIEAVGIEDSVQSNRAVAEGSIHATIFEHQWYMKQVADANGFELTPTIELYQWAFGLYSTRYDSVEELPDGATLAVPTDLANQGQALWLLDREGLITLDPDIEPRTAKLKDVVDNPRGFEFTEIDLLSMARTLDSVDVAIGYTNLFDAGKVGRDKGILFPDPPRTFASRLIVGTQFADTPETQKLIEVFSDPRLEEYLKTTDDPLVAGVLTPVSAE